MSLLEDESNINPTSTKGYTMKKTAHIDIYKGFESFTEILKWLREDWQHRRVKYDGDKEIGVFLDWNEKTQKHDILGDNDADSFQMMNRWFDDDPEIESFEFYFDENGKPLDEEFAKDYDLTKFVGEETVEEK